MADARPRVFLSYRREDTRHLAGRLADHLRPRFQLFMDVETIRPGADFAQAVQQAISESEVVLALIGSDWLGARDEVGRLRLNDPQDWVVTEIATALAGHRTVIPVLVDDARMPGSTELPPALGGLASKQAVRLRHESFTDDVNRLAVAVDAAVQARRPAIPLLTAPAAPLPAPAPPPPEQAARPRSRTPVLLAALLAAAVVAAGVLVYAFVSNPSDRSASGAGSADGQSSRTATQPVQPPAGTGPTDEPTQPTDEPTTPEPQLDLPYGTTATFEHYDVTIDSGVQDPVYGFLADATVCLRKLTGSSEETSRISWEPWVVTGNSGTVYRAELLDESNQPPAMFTKSDQYHVDDCVQGVIPFGSVPADDPITEVGYSNSFGARATWHP